MIQCIFCKQTLANLQSLQEHSARCVEHPAVQELIDARNDLAVADSALGKMTRILHGTANALKGPPPDGVIWSWHDLPACAKALVSRLAEAEKAQETPDGK